MNCPHCFGLGYDASGQRCTCTNACPPAKVARVRQRIPGLPPLPPSTWRQRLRAIAEWALLGLSVAACVTAVILAIAIYPRAAKAYDCTLAEISPDYPTQARAACRQLRRTA